MEINNIKYLFTITGGGWTSSHKLYVITPDNSVYYTEKFTENNILSIEPEFLFKLNENLDFEQHKCSIGFDASECSMYKVENGELKHLYTVGMYDNTPAVDRILKLKYILFSKRGYIWWNFYIDFNKYNNV